MAQGTLCVGGAVPGGGGWRLGCQQAVVFASPAPHGRFPHPCLLASAAAAAPPRPPPPPPPPPPPFSRQPEPACVRQRVHPGDCHMHRSHQDGCARRQGGLLVLRAGGLQTDTVCVLLLEPACPEAAPLREGPAFCRTHHTKPSTSAAPRAPASPFPPHSQAAAGGDAGPSRGRAGAHGATQEGAGAAAGAGAAGAGRPAARLMLVLCSRRRSRHCLRPACHLTVYSHDATAA